MVVFTSEGNSVPSFTAGATVRVLFLLPNINSSCYNLISLFSSSFPQGESVLITILYLDESHLYSALHFTKYFKHVISLNFWRTQGAECYFLPFHRTAWKDDRTYSESRGLYMTQMGFEPRCLRFKTPSCFPDIRSHPQYTRRVVVYLVLLWLTTIMSYWCMFSQLLFSTPAFNVTVLFWAIWFPSVILAT